MQPKALEDILPTGAQLRAARALPGIDRKTLADRAGVSLPAARRMEPGLGTIQGRPGTFGKIAGASGGAGIEPVVDGARGAGNGRGARLKKHAERAAG